MIHFGKRILFLSPHPDDEVVACATTIKKAQLEGSRVFIAHLTNGCPSLDNMWPWERKKQTAKIERRHREANDAALRLGAEIVSFSNRPARSLRYAIPDVLREVQSLITAHQIDQLWVPAYEGGNVDHDVLNGLCSVLAQSMSVIEFAEYNFSGGKARSNTFPCLNETETVAILSSQEKHQKKALLDLYSSEKHNLFYVKLEQESYRSLSLYNYSVAPHTGVLWYERFRWVPFRHPRIDYTKSKEVCNAITSFVAQASAPPEPAKPRGQEHKG